MKDRALLCALAACLASSASADVTIESNPAPLEWGIAGTGPVTQGEATLFPSIINVAGATGVVLDINVTIMEGQHTWSDDLEITLRSPSGTVVTLMQDAGGLDDIGGDLIFDDQAASPIDDNEIGALVAGSYQTSVYGTADTTAPASNGSLLSLFNGENPNGNWELYVYDDAFSDTGSFADGWEIRIETFIPAPASATLLGIGGLAAIRRRR
ncbi:MAG: hypothetical protein Phyf2KO_24800 [Phycisphaerales bacterium]